jgi:uncharacterized protein
VKRRVARVIPSALLLLCAGCATPNSRFYTLTAPPHAAPPASGLAVVVGPVSVPAAVDRPEIVVTVSGNEVRLDEFNRWASPLQNNIARVVADNLVGLLGTPRVSVFAQTLTGEVDYRAGIEVQRFESAPGEAATLDAVWTVIRTKDSASRTGRTTVREAATEKSFDALAAAHSRAVARVSADIAAEIQALDRSRP